MLTHTCLNSSTINRIHYQPETKVLTVDFKRGKSYRYAGVPMEAYTNMTKFRSAGEFLAGVIVKHYKSLGSFDTPSAV